MATFKLYKDAKAEWRWRFQANNNKIVADSAEGYKNKSDCEAAISLLKREAPTAPVQEST